MAAFPRISIDPAFRFGKSRVKGTRITVGEVLGHMAAGLTEAELLEEFPGAEYVREALGTGVSDQQILDFAKARGFVLVTLDQELRVRSRSSDSCTPPAVIGGG